MKVSQATNKMSNQTKNEQMDRTNKMLMWMMPIMSLWIGFTIKQMLAGPGKLGVDSGLKGRQVFICHLGQQIQLVKSAVLEHYFTTL